MASNYLIHHHIEVGMALDKSKHGRLFQGHGTWVFTEYI